MTFTLAYTTKTVRSKERKDSAIRLKTYNWYIYNVYKLENVIHTKHKEYIRICRKELKIKVSLGYTYESSIYKIVYEQPGCIDRLISVRHNKKQIIMGLGNCVSLKGDKSVMIGRSSF